MLCSCGCPTTSLARLTTWAGAACCTTTVVQAASSCARTTTVGVPYGRPTPMRSWPRAGKRPNASTRRTKRPRSRTVEKPAAASCRRSGSAVCSWQLVLVPVHQLLLAPPRRLATGFGPTPELRTPSLDAALDWSRWGQNQLLQWSPNKFAGSQQVPCGRAGETEPVQLRVAKGDEVGCLP